MEIIAFASGKGGTGKTLMAACLGYALVKAKQRVLLVDADPATDGLSLFFLGTQGTRQIGEFTESNTFAGMLRHFREKETILYEPRRINRSESGELGGHGVFYNVLISSKGLYGDEPVKDTRLVVPDLDQSTFRKAIEGFFQHLRTSSEYDYVLVDTRGGFAFESTDICALADSFIVITEPDFTSFYQDRNLVKRISLSSEQLNTRPLLRSIIVNKATEGETTDGQLDLRKLEHSFRLELEKEFRPLKFSDTHAVPVDIDALKAYKTQRIPYLAAPASAFAFATLSAFRDILETVITKWSEDQVMEWNRLIETVSHAIRDRNARTLKEIEEHTKRDAEVLELHKEVTTQQERIEFLTQENERLEKAHEREIARVEALLSSTMKEQISTKEEQKRQVIVRTVWVTLFAVMIGVLPSIWFINFQKKATVDRKPSANVTADHTATFGVSGNFENGWAYSPSSEVTIDLQTGLEVSANIEIADTGEIFSGKPVYQITSNWEWQNQGTLKGSLQLQNPASFVGFPGGYLPHAAYWTPSLGHNVNSRNTYLRPLP